LKLDAQFRRVIILNVGKSKPTKLALLTATEQCRRPYMVHVNTQKKGLKNSEQTLKS
jgi:hypothetical protein